MISDIPAINLIDGYKTDHRPQYPEGTEFVLSNFTARKSRIPGVTSVKFCMLQYFVKEYLIDRYNKTFFEKPKAEVLRQYKRRLDNYLGEDAVSIEHIGELHDLGYLPIKIKALPEGSSVPIGVPMFTIVNTIQQFFWLTNSLETVISNVMWKPITSLTTAFMYRQRLEAHAKKVGYGPEIIQWQAHDFSMRGMSGNEDALMSSAAHLFMFTGTDCIPAIDFLEMFYNTNSDKELIGGSVPATEHSVMCMGQKESEVETFRRLITKIYPSGIVSVVSDTWDFWKVMTEYLVILKSEILARDGRVVIRPDSGDPVKIVCGTAIEVDDLGYDATGRAYPPVENGWNEVYKFEGGYYKIVGDYSHTEWEEVEEKPEYKGAYEVLWDIFGGHVNDLGFKVLNTKVGLIYGDSITLERQDQILNQLEAKGFSASNLVFGVGSFSYEYVTRDTHGMAMKATWGMVDGEPRDIFKDPKTDDGTKKSAKGLLAIRKDENGVYYLKDQCTYEEALDCEMDVIFHNGKLLKEYTLAEIRANLTESL